MLATKLLKFELNYKVSKALDALNAFKPPIFCITDRFLHTILYYVEELFRWRKCLLGKVKQEHTAKLMGVVSQDINSQFTYGHSFNYGSISFVQHCSFMIMDTKYRFLAWPIQIF